MTFEELEKHLIKNNSNIKKFAETVGMKAQSINANYKNKSKHLPDYYSNLLELYIELKNEKIKNEELKKKSNIGLDELLDEKARKIAYSKCTKNNLTIQEYLSSLVISKI